MCALFFRREGGVDFCACRKNYGRRKESRFTRRRALVHVGGLKKLWKQTENIGENFLRKTIYNFYLKWGNYFAIVRQNRE